MANEKASEKSVSSAHQKTFTEAQVAKIVSERLARERKAAPALSRIRDMIMNLAKDGIIKARSIPEMGEELAEIIKALEGGNTIAIGKAETSEQGSENAGSEDKYIEISDFIRIFPDVDIDGLLENEAFADYIEDREGTLISLYAGFIKENAAKLEYEAEKRKQLLRSGLSSTGFSAKKSAGEDYSSILTPTQMKIARDAGMSYREYADYLSQLKARA